MTNPVPEHPEHSDHPDHPDSGPEVTIEVNAKEVRIHRGNRTVEEIKAAAGVNPADKLEQIIEGVITPLPNDGRVLIRGGEQFIACVPSGAGA